MKKQRKTRRKTKLTINFLSVLSRHQSILLPVQNQGRAFHSGGLGEVVKALFDEELAKGAHHVLHYLLDAREWRNEDHTADPASGCQLDDGTGPEAPSH